MMYDIPSYIYKKQYSYGIVHTNIEKYICDIITMGCTSLLRSLVRCLENNPFGY